MHLNIRSSYSLLSGLMHVATIAQKAKDEGMRAVALTDYHVLYGALNFQIECQKRGIKPLFGMDITIDGGVMVSALAKNNAGYQSLITISYELSKTPSITLERLSALASDLIIIAHGESGPFEADCAIDDFEGVARSIAMYQDLFKTFYIGVSHQESQYFARINQQLVMVANDQGVKCVAMTKVLYEHFDDADTYRIVRAIDKGTYFDDKTLVSAPNRHFLSVKAMQDLYDPALLREIDAIIDMCDVDVAALRSDLPHFPITQDVSADVYLQKLSQFGLKKRLKGQDNPHYDARLTYELDVINSMGFTDYFLIVYDVIRFAKKEGIYVGPGRGSSAGSLVAYSLGITDVDPIEYDLLFERFLNPKRISMPDIDIDFPDNKRDHVIAYVREKYGDAYVGHIVTFGTMKAKQSFRDVSRVFQVPVRFVDTIAKLITADSLQENYENVVKFRTAITADKTLKRVYDAALRVEGLLRHRSIHPAGIVVSQKPLLDVVPIVAEGSDLNVIQYDMTRLESLGLIKIDFLGLRNLTIIDAIVQAIRVHDPHFKITAIALDDAKTFAMLAKGETMGVFQLESDGMKSLMKRMKPARFMDIVDAIALYRPGPMENIPLYLKSRENPENVDYLHPDLQKITASTYGVLVYQEQIMQATQVMAGFDLAQADILRKAMGKKDIKQLESLKEAFLKGVVQQGHTPALAQSLYDLIEKFANYGFNKSHSVAYGLVSYQMAYLKANYPHYFYTSLLTSVIGSDVKTRQYIDECRQRGIQVLGPNLLQSDATYQADGAKIVVPLTAIKGISPTTSQAIVDERKRQGPYRSFFDAISRLSLLGLRKNQLEALIKAGALDFTNINRTSLSHALEDALRYTNIIKVETNAGVSLNHDLVSEPLIVMMNDRVLDVLSAEYDVLGMYFSKHPTQGLQAAGDVLIDALKDGQQGVGVVGLIEHIKNHKTKQGDAMAFVLISDATGSIDAVLFPRVYERAQASLVKGEVIRVRGKVQQGGSLIVDGVESL